MPDDHPVAPRAQTTSIKTPDQLQQAKRPAGDLPKAGSPRGTPPGETQKPIGGVLRQLETERGHG